MIFVQFTIITLVSFYVFYPLHGDIIVKRSDGENATEAANTTVTTPIVEFCFNRTPCGWAVYNKTSRFIEYFMKNQCICPKTKACLREDDDVSIAAYVYRCSIEKPKTEV